MQQDLIFTIVDNHLTASNDASGSIYPKPDKITYSSIFECEQCEHLDEGILSLAKADKECISNFGNPKQSCSQIFKGRRVYYTKPFALWLKLNRDRLINNKSSNRFKYYIMPLLLVFLIGCSGLINKNAGVIGGASRAEDKSKAKIEEVQKKLDVANVKRLEFVGQYAYGVGIVNTNQVVRELNDRIMSLAIQPSLKDMLDMQDLVDQLKTNNMRLLLAKDKTIESLQNTIVDLKKDNQNKIDSYIALADKTALKADQYKETLGEMDGFMGFGAMWYGLKKFVTSSMWILGIGGVLFIILRFASLSNPFAASIFSIFSRIGSWFINAIEIIVPKALDKAGQVSVAIYNKSRGILEKIVDNIQSLKELEKKVGHDLTVKELLDELDKSLDVNEKAEIDKIKKEWGY